MLFRETSSVFSLKRYWTLGATRWVFVCDIVIYYDATIIQNTKAAGDLAGYPLCDLMTGGDGCVQVIGRWKRITTLSHLHPINLHSEDEDGCHDPQQMKEDLPSHQQS